MNFRLAICAPLLNALLGASIAGAQWQFDGVEIVDGGGDQRLTDLFADGDGGAWAIGWTLSNCGRIWAQRVSKFGQRFPGWPDSGVVLRSPCAGSAVGSPVAVPDGSGGAFVAWKERIPCCSGADRSFLQHVDDTGVLASGWTMDAIPVSSAAGDQRNPRLVSDGAGGVICFWNDGSVKYTFQRFTASGETAAGWPATGRVLPSATSPSFSTLEGLAAISDGLGGAFVAWPDRRDVATTDIDVYVLRLDSNGLAAAGWPASGVAACAAPGRQGFVNGLLLLVPDRADGVFVLWPDNRDGTYARPFAQRITGEGALATGWSADGVALTSAQVTPVSSGMNYSVVADGAGGVIAAWADYRAGNNQRDIYAQHVNADGTIVTGWSVDGLVVCDAQSYQGISRLACASDQSGGAYVAWSDTRRNPPCCPHDVYVQRLQGSGAPADGWPINGIPLATAGTNGSPYVAPDAAGGLILAWETSRVGTDGSDVFAGHVDGHGSVVDAGPEILPTPIRLRLAAPYPSPARGTVALRFDIAIAAHYSLEVFNVAGQRVRTIFTHRILPSGSGSADWNGTSDAGASVPRGVYYMVLRGGGERVARRVVWLD